MTHAGLLKQYWNVGEEYSSSLEQFLQAKKDVFVGPGNHAYPLMSSFDYEQDYLEWYGDNLSTLIVRIREFVLINRDEYKLIYRMLKQAPDLIDDYTILPITEERIPDAVTIAKGDIVLGKVVRPIVTLPNNKAYPLYNEL